MSKKLNNIHFIKQTRNHRLYVEEKQKTIELSIEHTKGISSIELTLDDTISLEDKLRELIINLTIK